MPNPSDCSPPGISHGVSLSPSDTFKGLTPGSDPSSRHLWDIALEHVHKGLTPGSDPSSRLILLVTFGT
jgi:hypothetical protein